MRVDWFLRELAERGVLVSLKDSGTLRVEGDASDADMRAIREFKPEILGHLQAGRRRDRSADWDALRRLGPFLGREVDTGEPWGRGLLWGLSPYGAAVRFDPCIVPFEPGRVRTV